MKAVLNQIKVKYCSICHVGTPSKLVGYKSSGTCLDYVYDKLKIPYSLAWEIYSGEEYWPELDTFLKVKTNSSGVKNLRNENDINLNSISNLNLSPYLKSSFLKIQDADKLVDRSLNEWTNSNLNINILNKLLSTRSYSGEENETCAVVFNPISKIKYDYVIRNWINAFVHLTNYIKNN